VHIPTVDLQQIEAHRYAAVALPADKRAEVGPALGVHCDPLGLEEQLGPGSAAAAGATAESRREILAREKNARPPSL
jgi:hypothetical protein